MTNLFTKGNHVDIPQVLANRDHRSAVQTKLAQDHPDQVVVASKLNIPGPVKNNQAIQTFFEREMAGFEAFLADRGLLFRQMTDWLAEETGPESFYLIASDAVSTKRVTTAFEESTAYRRLFDLDVIYLGERGKVLSISRRDLDLPTRRCLICGRDAKDCGRSRRHSVAELQEKVSELIATEQGRYQAQTDSEYLATLAVKAMLYEASAWPKPGLVDPVEHLAHPDMDYFMFINSASSLKPYFQRCAAVGINYHGTDYPAMFEEIRHFGQRAEKVMLKATGGKNTHKGAIFSLGILTTAVGYCRHHLSKLDAANIQRVVKKMLAHLLSEDFSNIKEGQATAGEKEYLKLGLTGARGEAAAGFPTVFEVGLPAFRQAKGDLNAKLVNCLLQIARATKDSNLIKRAGGVEIIAWKDQQIDACLKLGGLGTKAGRQAVIEMQKEFSARHLSLGGSADLLILTVFLAMLEDEGFACSGK